MPGKHVHFVDSDLLSTPSSTFSASTLSSSPGPNTPPPVWHSPVSSTISAIGSPRMGSPYKFVTSSAPVQIHTLLAHTPGLGPALDWDLTQPAESARPRLPNLPSRLTDTLVAEPATNPPLPALAIICEHLPWTLTITPTPHAIWSAPFVTVGDVLHALHRALRLGVTDPELAVQGPAQRDRVHDAYVRRYRRAHAATRDTEKAKGIKRVDFLREQRAFKGFSMVHGGLPAKGLPHGAVWALHVAKA